MGVIKEHQLWAGTVAHRAYGEAPSGGGGGCDGSGNVGAGARGEMIIYEYFR